MIFLIFLLNCTSYNTQWIFKLNWLSFIKIYKWKWDNHLSYKATLGAVHIFCNSIYSIQDFSLSTDVKKCLTILIFYCIIYGTNALNLSVFHNQLWCFLTLNKINWRVVRGIFVIVMHGFVVLIYLFIYFLFIFSFF